MNRSIRSVIQWHTSHPTLILLVLVLVALALRLYRLAAQDIWGDEAFSIYLSSKPLDQVVAGGADTHPPFYPALLFVWLRLVGSLAFSTRALSAFIGVLVVPLIWVFAHQLDRRRPGIAWLAALLAAASPLLIYYSQETRMYELAAVLTLVFMYLALRVLSDLSFHRPVWVSGAAYFCSTALALYTHYYAFFALAAANIFAIVYLRKQTRTFARWLAIQIALVVAYVPWVVVQSSFLGGKASTRFDEWGWRGVELVFGKTLLAFGAGLTLEAPAAQIAALSFVLVAFMGIAVILLRRDAKLVFAPLFFGIPLFIAWLVNPILPFFYERYVLLALPGLYLLVAIGLEGLARRSVLAASGTFLLLIFFSGMALWNYYYNDAYAKGKYGQMMAFVSGHAQPGDALILNNPLQKPLYEYYRPSAIQAFFLPDGTPLEDPSTRQQLVDIASKHNRVWLVMYGNPAEYDPTGYLERWLGTHAFKSLFRGFVDASLSLYVTGEPVPSVMSETMHYSLGDISLIGYDLDGNRFAPGQTLRLKLRWYANTTVHKRYSVFTHLISLGDSGRINPETGSPVWAQMDGEPVGGSYPTNRWKEGETIEDSYGLTLPSKMPTGEYGLEVGMYDPGTLVRLAVLDEKGIRQEEDRILLGTVQVGGP